MSDRQLVAVAWRHPNRDPGSTAFRKPPGLRMDENPVLCRVFPL